MNETILTVFVIATCVAVIIQMGILIGILSSCFGSWGGPVSIY